MYPETAKLIKKEELVEMPDEPDSMGCTVVAMYPETATLIKKEEIVETTDEPDLLSPEDPLDIGEASLHVKHEHVLKHHLDGSEHNGCTVAAMYPETATLIKKEEIVEMTDEPDSMSAEDPLYIGESSLHGKQEHELKHHVDGSKHNGCTVDAIYPETATLIIKEEIVETPHEPDLLSAEDPLYIGESSLHGKQEHELKHHVDGSKNNVATSTASESESTRLIELSSESCYVSSEEAVKQEVVPSELEIGAGESMSFNMFGIQTQQTKEEDEGLFGIRLKCRLTKKEFQKLNCSFCLQSFPSKYKLIMHVFIHIDGVEPPEYICKSCGKVFRSNISLNRHVKISAAVQAPFDGHRCVICGKSFTQLNNLKQHSLIHTGSKPHKCVVCGKCFTQSSNLKRHSLTHTGTQPHKCDICEKSFTQLGSLKKHSLIHMKLKPHICVTCGKCFRQLSALKTHSLIHTRAIPHKCDICGKSFIQLRGLKRHLLIHTGLKTNKCDICGKSFTQVAQLKIHSLIHTGSHPHKCVICGKSFTKLSILKTHSLIHTRSKPHICDICGKSFIWMCHLKIHSLIHTGSKPHTCDLCGKSFTRLNNLKQHSLIHTGSKPHKCVMCGKCFTQLSTLKTHTLIHTG